MRARLAIVLPLLSAALLLVGNVLALSVAGEDETSETVSLLSFAFPVAAFAAVGFLIARRQPDNPIGWLLIAVGVCFALVVGCVGTAIWALREDTLPQDLAEWIYVPANSWVLGLGLLGNQIPLRLPDGRLPSPRWRLFSRVSIGLIAVTFVTMAMQPGGVEGEPGTANPIGAGFARPLAAVILLMILSFGGAIYSLFRRYRRADARERLQLRWIAFGGVLFLGVYVLSLVIPAVAGWEEESTGADLAAYVSQFAFGALPIAIGVAILRHRLYDLGVVVNRTLVYAGLTATLAAAYLAVVLLLQLVLQPVTEQSDLAIAGSTLAVAALARPARARIQALVDRRFYRRRYDAAQTIESFGARLRDQVELDAVSADLRAVVTDTMQPAHLSLWLRKAPR